MEIADLYGASLPGTSGSPDAATAVASGPVEFVNGPAAYLVAIIGLLIFIRVLYEIAD